jgi:hypothetical protein
MKRTVIEKEKIMDKSWESLEAALVPLDRS